MMNRDELQAMLTVQPDDGGCNEGSSDGEGSQHGFSVKRQDHIIERF